MPKIAINQAEKIHFIGIGGIGISAIARMMLLNGKEVRGSDESPSKITEELAEAGAEISAKHSAENLSKDTDLVVYTVAIDEDNPELKKAKELNIPTLTYPEMLGLISRDHYTVAISGTHGKTTTTGMIAQIAIDTGLDPTVIIGSVFKNGMDSNFVAGRSKLLITEACEYKRSFLNLQPNILVITNIDKDHLDYYKDLDDIQNAFIELAGKLGEDDFLVCNTEDESLTPVVANAICTVINYISSTENPCFSVKLKVFGKYNMENAMAAFAVAEILKVKEQDALSALSEFEGVWRRFEYKGRTGKGAYLYDDYAHHPTEIHAMLGTARDKFPAQKITIVFQPHLYSRTKLLLDDFAESFNSVDEVLLAPIYAAREKKDPSINSTILADEIKKRGTKARQFDNLSEIEQYLIRTCGNGDIIITVGAGDIYKIGEQIIVK